jgi:hypothetical protein
MQAKLAPPHSDAYYNLSILHLLQAVLRGAAVLMNMLC